MRSVEEWIGKDDDAIPPPRVRLRIFDVLEGRCHMCARKIMAGEYWVCEHMVAICNGGENRESNLNLTCRNCVPLKNAADLAEKSRVNRIRSKHLGIKQRKGKPMAGTKASPFKRKMNGAVERRT